MTSRVAWKHSVGKRGRHVVTVLELPTRDYTLYLRWWVDSPKGRKPVHQSLDRKLRTADGKIVKETERWAKQQAQEKLESLIRGDETRAPDPAVPNAGLALGEVKALITDAKRGKYPTAT